MCNCRAEIEQGLTAKFKDDAPEAKDHRVELKGYASLFGDAALAEKGYMQIEMRACFPLKKGGEKEKKSKSSMIFTYCPFCAKPYE